MNVFSGGRSFACTKDELEAKPWSGVPGLSAPTDEAIEKAREELTKAETNGFRFCEPVFVLGDFDGLWVKAEADNDNKSWGRSDMYLRFIYRDGELVKDPTWVPPLPLKSWEAHGFECEVRANKVGSNCGYVQIPEGHPFHGKGYNECLRGPECREEWHYSCSYGNLFDVHGGLTFSGEGYSRGWWIGFDCSHLGDAASPEYQEKQRREYGYGFGDRDGHYWTIEEVAEETERLAAQVAAVKVNPDGTWTYLRTQED